MAEYFPQDEVEATKISDLEKVVNSIAEGDDLSTALRKHEPVPTCPNCGEAIDLIYTDKNINLRLVDGKWQMQIEDTYEVFLCPHCHEELNPDELDKLGVGNELR